MNRSGPASLVLALAALVSACSSAGPSPFPVGAPAYDVIPENAGVDQDDIIRAGDRLTIRVFGEPELSGEAYVVDSAGYLQVPLVGEVIAAGQTPRQFSAELARRLSNRYVRDASVTVAITDRPLATYTVEGSVTSPGTYPISGSTTLLTALAQAKSPNNVAKLDDILVLRTIDGKKAGGRFNLNDIRRGRAADPQILAGDTIVVINSATKSAWRDFLSAVPLLNLFTILRN